MLLQLSLSWLLLAAGGIHQAMAEQQNLRGHVPAMEPTSGTRSLLVMNLSAATAPLDWEETRESYVLYPDSASGILMHELEVIRAAIGLDVTTTMAHPDLHFEVWSLLKGIVHRFRKQNQIIHANPHYFISTGLEVGCRVMIVDPDTNLDKEVETIPVPGHCSHCTNHGRYCIMPPANSDRTGRDIIEETLRRICFAQIYHASDLRFWEYMEALHDLQCQAGAAQCSRDALRQVSQTSQRAIDNCMRLAGGTAEDNPNVHLQLEVDHRKSLNPNRSYGVRDLPMIYVGGKKYLSDDWSVEGLFPFICEIYREQTGMRPVACDFCEGCQDIRKCLWKLECDGKPFDVNEFMPEEASTTPPEIVIQPPPTTTTVPPAVLPPAAENATTVSPPLPGDLLPPVDAEPATPASNDTTFTAAPTPEDNVTAPTPAPTFDKYVEREKQQEEMDGIYLRWFIAACIILVIAFGYVCIREQRRRRKKALTERYKQETQARWRTRETDHMPDDYSTSWPIQLVPNPTNNTRISRKNRNKKSLHDQRINQDHSQTGQRTRFLDGLGFSRQSSLENTPAGGALALYNSRSLMPRGGGGGGGGDSMSASMGAQPGFSSMSATMGAQLGAQPGFSRHLSLEHRGAIRPGGRERGQQRRRRSWGDDEDANRLSPAHAAALMEAAATSTPVPAQPMTMSSTSTTTTTTRTSSSSPTRTTRRPRAPNTLEDILSEEEGSEDDSDNLNEVSERSNSDQLSYSTNWLTGYAGAGNITNHVPMNEGEMNDASQMFEGLEDVTTL